MKWTKPTKGKEEMNQTRLTYGLNGAGILNLQYCKKTEPWIASEKPVSEHVVVYWYNLDMPGSELHCSVIR
jgi:hypothetical protein